MSSPKPEPIFIVGCQRSGTTLLRDLVRSHPLIAIGSESEFIPFVLASHKDPKNESEARRLGRVISSRLRNRSFQVDLDADDFAHCRSVTEAVALPFERLAEQLGKPRWGDKTPFYVEHIDDIRSLFPRAKFVHIIRDGRDCALSIRQRHFGPNTVYHAALHWKHQVRCGRDARERLGPDVVHELRFEQLVAEPEAVLREILQFVDEAWDPAVLRRSPIERKGRKVRFGQQLPKPFRGREIQPNRAQRWPTAMSREEQAVFEGVAGDLLAELGYETRGLARRATLRERVIWRIENDTRRVWRNTQRGLLIQRLRDHILRSLGRIGRQ